MRSENDTAPLNVSCECGQRLPVKASEAGSELSCSCGRRVVVPLLEEFRDRPTLLSAATVERRVRRLIAEGELPPAGNCMRCGDVNTAEVVLINLECERYTARAHGGLRFLVLPFFSVLFWMWWREEERVEIRGRDTDVPAPVCLCETCRSCFRGGAGYAYLGLVALVVALAAVVGYLNLAAGVGVAVAGLLGLALWRRLAFWSRQRGLKGLLRQIPVYRQVLASYPKAVVVMPPEAPAGDGGDL
jgi:hypothetical protein